jgi:hypothetical protein
MPREGFELSILAFERAKILLVSDARPLCSAAINMEDVTKLNSMALVSM